MIGRPIGQRWHLYYRPHPSLTLPFQLGFPPWKNIKGFHHTQTLLCVMRVIVPLVSAAEPGRESERGSSVTTVIAERRSLAYPLQLSEGGTTCFLISYLDPSELVNANMACLQDLWEQSASPKSESSLSSSLWASVWEIKYTWCSSVCGSPWQHLRLVRRCRYGQKTDLPLWFEATHNNNEGFKFSSKQMVCGSI